MVLGMVSGMIPDDLPEGTKARLPAIIEGVALGKTNDEIAAELGVSRYVVVHDRLLWRRSDGYEVWVYEEFHRLHAAIANQHPITAYKEVSRLLAQVIGQKIKAEIKTQGKIEVDIGAGESIKEVLKEYEEVIDRVVEKVVKQAFSTDGIRE